MKTTSSEPPQYTGLSSVEVEKKLKEEGLNEIPSQQKRNFLSILFHVIIEPMLLLLLASGLLYLFLGEKQDALMLLLFVIVVIGITIYQERKTERALEALKNLSSPRALVIRDGVQKRIPGREVVRDDIIILREGDRVPADGVVLFCSNLQIDESLLTGESLAVRKTECNGALSPVQPGGDDLPFVYSGTLVVQGHGVARITAIGTHTEMGKIGKALETIHQEETLLKKEINLLVRNFAIGGVILFIIVVGIYSLTRGTWIDGFLAGLSLSMAILPEEFPVVLLIFLSMGSWRMSKREVLTRNTSAIETLGSATVLCVDKTGTLTLNKMILSTIYSKGETYTIDVKQQSPLPETFHDVFEFGYLASQKDPFDPIEKEIKQATEHFLSDSEHIHTQWTLIREYPLSKHIVALSHVWESYDKQHYVIAAKGSPESIIDLCHLDQPEKKEILAQVQNMAQNGLRVLGVARANFQKEQLPDTQHDFDFEFLGLLGFVDPVRTTVAGSLKECYAAGVRVIMITGDYPGTAQHIARQIGLQNPDQFITGTELKTMNEHDLRQKIKTVNIFARVVPEQKLLIVNALKANRDIVAMTGDGVNDAPALKAANIGIAMGERGTDVARESSALVLLNDDFSSIVQAIRLGRRIFDNLRKSISYIFSVHIPIAGMALVPIILNKSLVLLPAHIAFLELIIDPACSTVFEAEQEEEDIMNRPPRDLSQRLFHKKIFLRSLLQGLSALIAVIVVYLLYGSSNEEEARTLAFITLVLLNIMLIFVNLSWTTRKHKRGLNGSNKAFWFVITVALLSLILVLTVPILRELFHFSVLHFNDLPIVLLIVVICTLWFKIFDVKKIFARYIKKKKTA